MLAVHAAASTRVSRHRAKETWMSSQRLPGKVLRNVAGKPLLAYVLERLERARRLDTVVVATSIDPSDDPVAVFCADRGTACERGHPDDVAGRFVGVLDAFGFDAFVRVSGDSPLIDQRLVDDAVDRFEPRCDLVSNVSPRTFPHGQSVEVVRSAVFRAAYARMRDPEDLEHVTRFFYRHEDEFAICRLTGERDLSGIQLAVDTAADLDAVSAILKRMKRPHWEYGVEEILELGAPA